jgi:putative FmdB family regulatory protein
MPIYAYKCASCGHAKDVLQKISDDPLTVCPACGAAAFSKQLTAAGFQLKGSGWYATDFRGGSNAPAAEPAADAKTADGKAPDAKPADAKPAEAKPADASPAKTDSGSTASKSEAPSASGGH